MTKQKMDYGLLMHGLEPFGYLNMYKVTIHHSIGVLPIGMLLDMILLTKLITWSIPTLI